MIHQRPVVDADSHKCENPAVFFDYIPAGYRDRISLLRDRYGEQRFRILDRNPKTGDNDLVRVFLQPEGYGKGTFRPYHEETTIGGLFNRVRLAHMDREGIDHQVVYGSMTLAFSSIIDAELAVVLCRAYNDYIHDDCASYANRLHPVAVLPLQDPAEAIVEMRREISGLLGGRAITAGELEMARNGLVRSLPASWETLGDLSGSLEEIVTYNLPPDYYDRYVEGILALSAESVTATSAKLIDIDRFVWVVVGDLSQIRPQLEASDLGPVEEIDDPLV